MSANATIAIPAYAAPNRRHYAVLALLFVAVIVYGSLAPLRLRLLPFAEAVERFRLVLSHPIIVQSRSDWLANALLQLPFGFCLMAAICCDRPLSAALALPVALIACLALAGVVEFAQLYFPPRVSSINDIAAQGIGGATGAGVWLLRGQRLTALARRLWSDFGSRSTVHLLLALYLFILLIVQTLPFDFTLSPVEIYRKYKIGRIQLLPFAAYGIGSFELVKKYLWNVALFAPVGLLLAHLPSRASRNGVIAFGLGVTTAAAIEFAQLLAFSRFFDASDILTGSASVLAAWFVSRHYSALIGRQSFRGASLAGCLAVLIFMEWEPFDFVPSLKQASFRLHTVSLLPFVDYLQGSNYLDQLDDGIHKTLLFMTLGVVVTPPETATRAALVFCWVLAFTVAVVLEAGQLFLPSRCASVTDVLIAAASSWIGLLVTNRARKHWRPSWKHS